ncbi:MAG TPA: DNA gyrase inhibitor YacG [Terriglobia bacterium]|nr:DNA gyrase inhibitor YacG [Terriglobia bacterium]
MRCPICGKETAEKGNSFRPFCSERCKLIDLDNWLQGRYRISTWIQDHDDAEEAEAAEAVKADTVVEA